NLMEAVSKILGREIPSTIAVPSDDETDTPHLDRKERETDKKIPCTVNSLTSAEAVRLELIQTIQKLYQQGTSVMGIARITGKNWKTVQKYLEGDPEKLCRNNKSGCLDKYKNFIIQSIQEGIIQSKIIEQLMDMGYKRSKSNAQQYIKSLVREFGLKPEKYKSRDLNSDEKKTIELDYITRKGIFNHLWMDVRLSVNHYDYIWNKYPILEEVEKCIRQFREIFMKKNMPLLYLFIERYMNAGVKELASFANGLSKDIQAVENAVASRLSNGFVEGTNNKIKMVKRTMYGRCGKELLSAKLMYEQVV
ncbi:MAG: transposase, partial [Lachnospiraceae bacterium]|nr:transposase [Lachnospiraceae bacterium]